MRGRLDLDPVGPDVIEGVARAIQLTRDYIVDAHMAEILKTQRSQQAVQSRRETRGAQDEARRTLADLRWHLRQTLAAIEDEPSSARGLRN